LFNTRLNVLIHSYDSLFDQRLFYIIKASNDPVVVLNDKLKGHYLTAIDLGLFEELGSSLWDSTVKLLQIFYFSQQSHQNGVEVNFQQSIFFVLTALVIGDKELL
jgi:hypothetical protein